MSLLVLGNKEDTASSIASRLSSRKFLAMILLIVISSLLTVKGLVDSAGWLEFNKWIFGLYMAGNVGSAAVKAGTAAIDSKIQQSVNEALANSK